MSHTTTVPFTAASNWELGGGKFAMKDGSKTAESLNLSLYQGTSKAGPSLTNEQFCTLHGGNCQSFADTLMVFSAPVNLLAGQSYFLVLTSAANDAQSEAYFIKGLDKLAVQDSRGAALVGQTVGTTPTPTPVPEPGTVALLGLAVMGLGAARRHMR